MDWYEQHDAVTYCPLCGTEEYRCGYLSNNCSKQKDNRTLGEVIDEALIKINIDKKES